MLLSAVAFWQVVLAVHIVAVVVAFGVSFAYPLLAIVGRRLDPRAMPWFHRMQQQVGRRLISPGLGVVLLAGVYLASDLHQWRLFYVQWGLGAVVLLGALEGGFMIPREGRLAELSERDLAAAGSTEVEWSPEYRSLARQVSAVGALLSLIVVITVYLMTVRA